MKIITATIELKKCSDNIEECNDEDEDTWTSIKLKNVKKLYDL